MVVFILVFFPKFNMILEILVHWMTLLTVFSHCLENTLSQIFIMHRLAFLSSSLWRLTAGLLLIDGFILQIRINNSFVSSFREAIYKLKCRSEVCTYSLALYVNKSLDILSILGNCIDFLFVYQCCFDVSEIGNGTSIFIALTCIRNFTCFS